MGDAAAVAAAVIPAGGGGAAPAPAAIPAVGGGAAAQPAAAAPTAEELELESYGAPADIPKSLVDNFLELARSKPPIIEIDEGWGAKFAHPAGTSPSATCRATSSGPRALPLFRCWRFARASCSRA